MQKGLTIWFTGLSGSGKTTLSLMIEETLLERGLNVEVLDGDIVRENLSKGLGFSKEDRDINIRRIGFVCNLLTRNGAISIAAAISPYKATRDDIRKQVGRFVEIYVKCALDTLVERDTKGLYKKALAGEIKNFTGVNDPYEPPEDAEIMVETDKEAPEESHDKIIQTLEILGYLDKIEGVQYSDEESAKIKKRLKDLGYI
jgi:adenylyl-sulfate kinase